MNRASVEVHYAHLKPPMTGRLAVLLALLLTWLLSPVLRSTEALEASGEHSSNVPANPPVAKSIGPFQLCSNDSSAVIQLQFAGQLRADWKSADSGGDHDRECTFSTQARRVQPGVTVQLPKERVSFRLLLSTAPGSLELMDLYFNFSLGKSLQVRAGQYKIPFTRYRIQSFQRLTFVDWALTTKYFGAERQMGLAIHNGYERPPRWAYEFGVFSGANARASHAVGLSKIYGENAVNPSDLADPGPSANFHPEVVAHLSYNANGIQVRSDTDEEKGGLRRSVGLSLAWDLDPVNYQDLAVRVAPELLIKYRGTSFMSAGYLGFGDIGESYRTRLAMVGLATQASVRFSERYEVSLRYAVVDFDDYVLNDAYARGQELIGLAEDQLGDSAISQEDFDEVLARYKNAGNILREQELTAGLNIYFKGHSLKWQNDVGWLRQLQRDGDALNDIIVRSQLQIAF